MRARNRKEFLLLGLMALLALIPATLYWMRFKAAVLFVDYSSEAGRALMWQAGLYPDGAYQERGEEKPIKMDCPAFLNGPYRNCGRYYFHTNLLTHNPTNAAGISAIIEERWNAAPGPFFLRPLLPLVGWKPRRLAILNDGTMTGLVPREFEAIDLNPFESSDKRLNPQAN
jgi:hypothetical protein